jgi:hypothetical protein
MSDASADYQNVEDVVLRRMLSTPPKPHESPKESKGGDEQREKRKAS